jgi:hypothetical protein
VDIVILYLARASEGWELSGEDGPPSVFPTLVAGIRYAHGRLTAWSRRGAAGQLLVRRPDGAWEVVWAWEPAGKDTPPAVATPAEH